MWELWVQFYLGLTEDYSPGHSLSGSSEDLLQRGGGGGQCKYDFGERYEIKHSFQQKVAASHKEQVSPLMILILMRRYKKLGS